jgi:hypothetical protein
MANDVTEDVRVMKWLIRKNVSRIGLNGSK